MTFRFQYAPIVVGVSKIPDILDDIFNPSLVTIEKIDINRIMTMKTSLVFTLVAAKRYCPVLPRR
jgi:hypothetical protein